MVSMPVKGIARIAMQLVEPDATTNAGVMVVIDDQPVTLGPPWDGLALVASGRAAGGYFLGNCGCGVPACAGVRLPVQVQHEGEQVTWSVPQPYDPGKLNKPGTGRKSLAFDATQYPAQAACLLEAMRQLAKRPALCCYPTDRLCDVIAWADSGGAGHGRREDLSG